MPFDEPSSHGIVTEAGRLIDNGLSVIPARTQDKKPGRDADDQQDGHLMQWKPYQAATPSSADWDLWRAWNPQAMAIVCGNVSGNLEVLDFDDNMDEMLPRSVDEFWEPWWQQCGDLVELYGLPVVRTPGDGYQVFYGCETIDKSDKLAYVPSGKIKKDGEKHYVIAIETKAEGGYVIAPPSLRPKGRRYELISGDLANIPIIPAAVRAVFLETARLLNEKPAKPAPAASPSSYTNGRVHGNGHYAPGESVKAAFNDAYTVRQILEANGYTKASERRYSRPDKADSSGVDVNDGDNMAFVYSSNDQLFKSERQGPGGAVGYDAYGLFVELEFNGDAIAATKEAAKLLGIARPEPILDWSQMRNGNTSSSSVDDLIADVNTLDDVQSAREWAISAETIGRAAALPEEERLRLQIALQGKAGSTFVDRTWTKAVRTRMDQSGQQTSEAKQADQLLLLASEQADIFTAQNGETYAIFPEDEHHECHPLRSKGFRHFLIKLFYAAKRTLPSTQARQDAIDALEATASAETRQVYTRLGKHGDKIYIDLGTPQWEAVEVDAEGWRIVDRAPVPFYRPRGFAPLPLPLLGGTANDLRRHLNVSDDHWYMIAAWVLAALRDRGPYPILVLTGEQGTAKSTATRLLKSIIDPSEAAVRGAPKDIDDLMIAANNSWLLAYDNITRLTADASDALCRISTGGGYAKRALYTDADEVLINVMRPVVMNGITSFVERGDLMDRAVVVELSPIREDERVEESAFWAAFNSDRPKILGAFLDALSFALGSLPHVKLDRLPRMADFAKLATAAEPALGMTSGQFLSLYASNRTEGTESVLEASPIVRPLRELVVINGSWEGTATDLLKELERIASDNEKAAKAWPSAPNWVTKAIKTVAPALRTAGVVDARQKQVKGVKIWSIRRLNGNT